MNFKNAHIINVKERFFLLNVEILIVKHVRELYSLRMSQKIRADVNKSEM